MEQTTKQTIKQAILGTIVACFIILLDIIGIIELI